MTKPWIRSCQQLQWFIHQSLDWCSCCVWTCECCLFAQRQLVCGAWCATWSIAGGETRRRRDKCTTWWRGSSVRTAPYSLGRQTGSVFAYEFGTFFLSRCDEDSWWGLPREPGPTALPAHPTCQRLAGSAAGPVSPIFSFRPQSSFLG